jgi:prolyl oligopeptidase PreP (S9A serine peptidase family)
MFLMLPAPPGLDSQNPTILYVYGGLKVGVTPIFDSLRDRVARTC